MNKTLWKLDKIGDRLWLVATNAAQQAGALGIAGRGLAVVADEARKLALQVEIATEHALFDGDEINEELLTELALQLNFLAFNCAIEASRLGLNGKAAAVCADEVRRLAVETVGLFRQAERQLYQPYPKTRLQSVSQKQEFLCFTVDGSIISESLDNVIEVLGPYVQERTETHITFRQHTVPLADPFRLLGKKKENSCYVVLKTPWAEQNKTYAVAVDELLCLYFSPLGEPVEPPAALPLAPYSRECWENEDGEPYLFLDWPKIAAAGQP